MAILSFISRYILMYAMVDTVGNVYNNFNQFYMAGLMTAPMLLIELAVMRSMFQDRRRNALIIAASLIAALVFFLPIKQQAAISDRQFLRSMIPHHGGAILMCGGLRYRTPRSGSYVSRSSRVSRRRSI